MQGREDLAVPPCFPGKSLGARGDANGSIRPRLKGITAATLLKEKQLSRACCAPLALATFHLVAAL
ncbi:MAG TPA: hypothetical protein VLR89_04740 [Anaerolineaceae bacterium]|nr:hypothetical protein [Anaerolineaceae bacterium]